MAGKLLSFTHTQYIILPMYLGDYMQESVHGKVHVTSTYGHNYAKDAITLVSKNTIITEHVKRIPSVLP